MVQELFGTFFFLIDIWKLGTSWISRRGNLRKRGGWSRNGRRDDLPYQLCHLALKAICSCNTAKNLSGFTNFPASMFLFGVRKTFVLFDLLMPINCILEALWKQMSVYISISPWEDFCSRDIVTFYLLVVSWEEAE